MSRLKISTRLSAVLALMAVMLALVAAAALWQMGAMRSVTMDITGNWLPSVERINALNTNASDFRVAEFQHVLNTDDKAMAAIEQTISQLQSAFDVTHKAYVALISSDEERALHERFKAGWQQYLQVHDRVIKLSRANQNDEARALLEGEASRMFDEASALLDKLAELNSKGAATATQASEAAYATARNVLALALLVGLGVAVGAGVWLVRSIIAPLRLAQQAADRVASGDLTGTIDTRSEDEAGQVLRALDRMQTSLARVVSGVRQNSDSVATASAQIAQGNQDLSGRTEEQASALQQTAATMEELGTTVRNNAENAKQANQLAKGASEVSARGGDVVGQVVATMQGINESSRKINDIISVIDGIAFQTNILALNAAVEAARAGEQGRGFAVVASEVRSLAQRSAEAAKEIKALIGGSVDQVERGSALVDEAGKTMEEIVGSIRRVSDIVAEIAAASVEQSAGVSQVGEAVSQMDQTTQQNAALVEESAAAADSLRTQARQLVDAVAVFRVDHLATTRAVPATVPTPAATPAAPRPSATRAVAPATRASTPSPTPIPTRAPATPPERAPARSGADDWESF